MAPSSPIQPRGRTPLHQEEVYYISKNKKAINKTAALARALKPAAAAQACGTRRPPFAEVDTEREGFSLIDRTRRAAQADVSSEASTKELSPGEQAKSKLIAILQAIPEQDYSDALQTMRSYWLNGMHHGFQKGFGAGWTEHCNLAGEHKTAPASKRLPFGVHASSSARNHAGG